jgi:hypothetical protein
MRTKSTHENRAELYKTLLSMFLRIALNETEGLACFNFMHKSSGSRSPLQSVTCTRPGMHAQMCRQSAYPLETVCHERQGGGLTTVQRRSQKKSTSPGYLLRGQSKWDLLSWWCTLDTGSSTPVTFCMSEHQLYTKQCAATASTPMVQHSIIIGPVGLLKHRDEGFSVYETWTNMASATRLSTSSLCTTWDIIACRERISK